jgi:hypothetical protein
MCVCARLCVCVCARALVIQIIPMRQSSGDRWHQSIAPPPPLCQAEQELFAELQRALMRALVDPEPE